MLEQSFSASDDITGAHLDDIQTRLQAETAVPEGFLAAVQADKLLVYLLDVNNDIPRLSSCIVVHSDLRVTVSLNQAVISESQTRQTRQQSDPARLQRCIRLSWRRRSRQWSEPRLAVIQIIEKCAVSDTLCCRGRFYYQDAWSLSSGCWLTANIGHQLRIYGCRMSGMVIPANKLNGSTESLELG